MAFGNACPRCGNSALFHGFLGLKPACTSCGLRYDFADSGDGPAVFIILGAGAFVVAAALWTELTFQPPIWLLLAIFLPLATVICLALLRPIKAMMIHRQYRTRAEEGKLQR